MDLELGNPIFNLFGVGYCRNICCRLLYKSMFKLHNRVNSVDCLVDMRGSGLSLKTASVIGLLFGSFHLSLMRSSDEQHNADVICNGRSELERTYQTGQTVLVRQFSEVPEDHKESYVAQILKKTMERSLLSLIMSATAKVKLALTHYNSGYHLSNEAGHTTRRTDFVDEQREEKRNIALDNLVKNADARKELNKIIRIVSIGRGEKEIQDHPLLTVAESTAYYLMRQMDYSTGRIPLLSYRVLNNRLNLNFNGLFSYIGFMVALLCGFVFGKYMQELHETKLWFSHIRQVEQEISLRTEAGLYYSYYKFAVHPEMSFNSTIYALVHDNSTEFPRQINVFKRFNIYQELILAVLYKFFASFRLFRDYYLPKPILFYVYSCFTFAGFAGYMDCLFSHGCLQTSMIALEFSSLLICEKILHCHFSGCKMRALLSCCDSPMLLARNITSSSSSPPSYSLYFGSLLREYFFGADNITTIAVHLSAAVDIYGCNESDYTSSSQAFFLVVLAQFGQPMNIASICTTFNLSSIVILYLTTNQKRFVVRYLIETILFLAERMVLKAGINRVSIIFLKSVYIIVLTLLLSWLIRYLVGAEADTHIWTFIKAKIGLISRSSVPFETALYLCHGAFAYLDGDFFRRTSLNGCFPLFTAAILIVTLTTIYSLTLQCCDQESAPAFIDHFTPETIFIVIQSMLCGIVAVFTLRMKYLWFPQIALVACILPVMISKYSGRFIVEMVVIATITTLMYSHYGVYKEQLANEQEFYDPDTVALMEWIKRSTQPLTSWSGSMQLMAGVKACTGRNLANHPHFEDKWLRDRTLQLYQMYGRKTLTEMHEILTAHKVDYIILEDSICLAPSTGCSTKDLVDAANGDTPEYIMQKEINPEKSSLNLRFCDRIRYADDDTKHYFKLVFENPTFRVYEVLDGT
uniref:Uncharacterized protein n=1 Tax=Wuchereria bancrofti TaxID=6293 RepID=A0A1I8EZ95_WUCBA